MKPWRLKYFNYYTLAWKPECIVWNIKVGQPFVFEVLDFRPRELTFGRGWFFANSFFFPPLDVSEGGRKFASWLRVACVMGVGRSETCVEKWFVSKIKKILRLLDTHGSTFRETYWEISFDFLVNILVHNNVGNTSYLLAFWCNIVFYFFLFIWATLEIILKAL